MSTEDIRQITTYLQQNASRNEELYTSVIRLENKMENISEVVNKLSKVVMDGNGSSLVTRLALVESVQRVIVEKIDCIEKKQNAEQVTNAAMSTKVMVMWGVIVAVATGLGSLLVKVFIF